MIDQRFGTDGAAEALPDGAACGCDIDMAVARLEHAGWNAGRVVVARLRRHLAVVEPSRRLEIQHEYLGLQQRRRDLLALAGLFALEQGDENAERAENARRQVRNRNARAHRPASRLSRDRHEAAQALRDLVETGPVRVGPVLAKTGNARIDQPRIELAQCRIVDAEAPLHVGPVVLDHDIGLRGEPAKNLDALRRLQVEADRTLVAVQILEIRPMAGAAEPFALLHMFRQLDLDDIGAPVRELTRRCRAGPHAREIEHGKTGKRA